MGGGEKGTLLTKLKNEALKKNSIAVLHSCDDLM
jgi:hypothetical protein